MSENHCKMGRENHGNNLNEATVLDMVGIGAHPCLWDCRVGSSDCCLGSSRMWSGQGHTCSSTP